MQGARPEGRDFRLVLLSEENGCFQWRRNRKEALTSFQYEFRYCARLVSLPRLRNSFGLLDCDQDRFEDLPFSFERCANVALKRRRGLERA